MAGPVIKAAGGRALVRGEAARAFEGGLKQRVVAIEFESVEKAIGVYESEAYQTALKALGNGAERDLRIIEGL